MALELFVVSERDSGLTHESYLLNPGGHEKKPDFRGNTSRLVVVRCDEDGEGIVYAKELNLFDPVRYTLEQSDIVGHVPKDQPVCVPIYGTHNRIDSLIIARNASEIDSPTPLLKCFGVEMSLN